MLGRPSWRKYQNGLVSEAWTLTVAYCSKDVVISVVVVWFIIIIIIIIITFFQYMKQVKNYKSRKNRLFKPGKKYINKLIKVDIDYKDNA